MELPTTETRIREHTSEQINERIFRELEARIYYYARNQDRIDDRLAELNQEWDMERMLETSASGLSIFGMLMASRNRKWLLMPLAVGGFLLQHALQGWCPPVSILRRIGVRTIQEINRERYALKTLRGDFDDINVSDSGDNEEKIRRILHVLQHDFDY